MRPRRMIVYRSATMLKPVEKVGEATRCLGGGYFRHVIRLSDFVGDATEVFLVAAHVCSSVFRSAATLVG